MTTFDEQIPPENKRRHPRRSYLQSVTIHISDRTSRGMIQNISTGGIYIETSESFSTGQKITISYPLSNNSREIEVQGEVAWTDQNGFAMKYL